MDNAVYITLTRQLALFRDMAVTANNIANANSTGYNANHLIFNSYVMKDVNQGDRNPMAFANDVTTFRNTKTGSFTTTGNKLDVAIEGEGYFSVQTPLGTRYTRAGNFTVDNNGTLTTPEGYAVLDSAGQTIIMPEDATSVVIGSAGNMKVNGEDFSTIGVVKFENPQLMERLGSSLYKSDIQPQPAENYNMAQGMLENSNVQPVLQLTHMIDVSRSVSSTAKFIEVMYDLQRKTASTWVKQG